MSSRRSRQRDERGLRWNAACLTLQVPHHCYASGAPREQGYFCPKKSEGYIFCAPETVVQSGSPVSVQATVSVDPCIPCHSSSVGRYVAARGWW